MSNSTYEPSEPRRLSNEERRWEWLVFNDDKLTPTQRMVLLVLFRWHIRYREIFLSLETIAKHVGCCERTIKTVAAELEVEGWFRRQHLGKGTTRRAYSYTLRFPNYFAKDGDEEVLLAWKRERLSRRLEWRLENDPGWYNWRDAKELISELVDLGVDVVGLGCEQEDVDLALTA